MEFIVLAFATYAFSEAVTNTEGPFKIFYKLREQKYSKFFECFTCFSFTAGLLLSAIIAPDYKTWFLTGVGAAGAAIFLNYLSDNW